MTCPKLYQQTGLSSAQFCSENPKSLGWHFGVDFVELGIVWGTLPIVRPHLHDLGNIGLPSSCHTLRERLTFCQKAWQQTFLARNAFRCLLGFLVHPFIAHRVTVTFDPQNIKSKGRVCSTSPNVIHLVYDFVSQVLRWSRLTDMQRFYDCLIV